METTNSNLTSPSKPKSKFSNNFKNTENNELLFKMPGLKKYSEDLTQSSFPSNQSANQRLIEIKRRKFATLTPLLTPRTLSFSHPTPTPSLEQCQSAIIPQIPKSNFKKLCKLGNGFQALRCFKCIDARTNEIVVVKEIKNNDEEICSQFQAEYKFIENLDHSNIIKAKEFIKEKDCCKLVMEYAEGKQLSHYLNKLKEEQIINISKQLLSALVYLHEKNIMHRDLHLNNIIYQKENGKIMIIDFGIAKQLNDKMLGLSCAGEIDYRAPEMLNYQPYTCKIDCWQAGLILLQLVNHKKTTSLRITAKEALNLLLDR